MFLRWFPRICIWTKEAGLHYHFTGVKTRPSQKATGYHDLLWLSNNNLTLLTCHFFYEILNFESQQHLTKLQNKMSKSLDLLTNVHDCENIKVPNIIGNTYLVRGDYEYYHYLCDGFDDRGWGCGYRTLQTICSWLKHNYKGRDVPSIREIQEILVQLEDKPRDFLGSRQWIGSFEVCLVIDKLYDIPCKILHVNNGKELNSLVETIKRHFETFGSPIMMGGDVDCSSKGVMGINIHENGASLLILDPHYVGNKQTKEFLVNKGWIKWQPLQEFLTSSFYNLCLPQVAGKVDQK